MIWESRAPDPVRDFHYNHCISHPMVILKCPVMCSILDKCAIFVFRCHLNPRQINREIRIHSETGKKEISFELFYVTAGKNFTS